MVNKKLILAETLLFLAALSVFAARLTYKPMLLAPQPAMACMGRK
jgi:hypothetical protein